MIEIKEDSMTRAMISPSLTTDARIKSTSEATKLTTDQDLFSRL